MTGGRITSQCEGQYRVKLGGVLGIPVPDAVRVDDYGERPNLDDMDRDNIPAGTIVNLAECLTDGRLYGLHDDVYYKGWISTSEGYGRKYYFFTVSGFSKLERIRGLVKRADDQHNYEGGRRTRNKRKSRKHRGRSGRRRRM